MFEKILSDSNIIIGQDRKYLDSRAKRSFKDLAPPRAGVSWVAKFSLISVYCIRS